MTTTMPAAVDVLPNTILGNTPEAGLHASLTDNQSDAIMAVERILVGPTHYNVKGYGALGDGATDDRVAIQNALAAANNAGGGIVHCPPGTYMVSAAVHPTNATFNAGLVVGTNTIVRGAGMGATTIKLMANQGSTTSSGNFQGILMNYLIGGFDGNITVEDLTLDGNAANNANNWWFGSLMYRVRFLKHNRVKVVNVKGSGNAPPGERFAFEASGCGDVSYVDCIVQTSPGSHHTSTGFSADLSTNVSYMGCWSIGIVAQTDGHGYTHNGCNGVAYTNCFAMLNGSNGFNSEVSNYVKYVGCFAGMYTVAASGEVYPNNISVGNAVTGFNVAAAGSDVTLDNCSAIGNGYGIAATGSSIRVSVGGCTVQGNTIAGLLQDGTCRYLKADRLTHIFGNAIDIQGYWQIGDTVAVNLVAGSGTGSNTQIASSITSIPANTFDVDGRALRIRVWGSFAANNNNKGVALAFGVGNPHIATSVLQGALTNGASWQIDVTLIRTSSGHQMATSLTTYTSVTNVTSSTTTQDDTLELFLSVIQTVGSNTSGDVLFSGLTVEIL